MFHFIEVVIRYVFYNYAVDDGGSDYSHESNALLLCE